MNVSVKWCLENIKKAYRLHFFKGSLRQFEQVLIKANEIGIEYTRDIPKELIREVVQ